MKSEPGKGTTFIVYLSLMAKAQDDDMTKEQVKLKFGDERILLVDDDESVARLESLLLKKLGYKVTERTSSVEALAAFRANLDHFDLVITDMAMPNMTGDQLSSELLSIKPGIPIIICTGFSERLNKEMAESIGIKGFLMKPVVKSDMARMVRNVLDAKR